ncbi:MAG: hypothetical protein E6Q98_15875 [Rhodospirillaceae bacterium]|nr:MAG: hypothetical protein E6Q98_15875 [Rhodospirillaceae bacterium]
MDTIAEHVITKCGGPKAVAKALNLSLQRVYCWTYSKEKGGTDGLVPAKHQQRLLESFPELKPEDFFAKRAA